MAEFLIYKGKPLVRKGNEMYYGNMTDKCVVKFDILSEKEENGQKVPDRISVALMLSDVNLPDNKRILKKSEKSGYYEAIDLGVTWLERELKN